MSNKNLGNAKKAKNDEFYTRREDIEAELWHYKDHFNGKTVYMNCDDPEKSEFWQFFVRNYRPWGIKKLLATNYEPDARNFSYKLEYPLDADTADIRTKPIITPIQSNGDFRSECCIELLKEADIVVTNPPFSLFREYIGQLIKYEKEFLVLRSMNAITYKEIFPLIKDEKIWLGVNSGKKTYIVPMNIPDTSKTYIDSETGLRMQDMGNTCCTQILTLKSAICLSIFAATTTIRKNIPNMTIMTPLRFRK